MIDIGELFHFGGSCVEYEQIANADWSRDRHCKLGRVRCSAVGVDIAIALSERLDFPGLGVNALQIGAPFFGGADENVATIFAPQRFRL